VPRGATQDRAGPMGRSVYDVTTLYSIIAGWDAEDFTTFNPIGHFPNGDWAQDLKSADLKGKRIGILREMIPTGPQYAEGRAIFEQAVEDLRKAGAYIVDPILSGSPNMIQDTAQTRGRTAEYEKVAFTNAYLARLGSAAKYKTVEEMIEKVGIEKFGNSMATALKLPAPDESPEYLARYRSRKAYIALIEELQARFDLDGFVQPFTIAPPASTDAARDPNAAPRPRDPMAVNNITSTLGLPAVVVPGGYTPSQNFPIAIQFFGKPFSDKTVIGLAYAYEQVSQRRKSPESVPALPGEKFDY
jgi:amidase